MCRRRKSRKIENDPTTKIPGAKENTRRHRLAQKTYLVKLRTRYILYSKISTHIIIILYNRTAASHLRNAQMYVVIFYTYLL